MATPPCPVTRPAWGDHLPQKEQVVTRRPRKPPPPPPPPGRRAGPDGGDEGARAIEDDDVIALEGEPRIQLRALHTPGHALGHLCFHDEDRGVLLTGGNIVGLGSVLIDPPQGNMRDYLDSLERMRSLPNLTVLLGGHGPAIATPYQKIDEYISHRLERERNILEAVQAGSTTPKEIVEKVYTDVSPKAHGMAERAVLAHLEKLKDEGKLNLEL